MRKEQHLPLGLTVFGVLLTFISSASILLYTYGNPTRSAPANFWTLTYIQLGVGIVLLTTGLIGYSRNQPSAGYRRIAAGLAFSIVLVCYPAALWGGWESAVGSGRAALAGFVAGGAALWIGLLVAVALLIRSDASKKDRGRGEREGR